MQAQLSGDRAKAYDAIKQASLLAPQSAYTYQFGLDAIRFNHPKAAVEAYMALDPEAEWMRGWYLYWKNLTTAYHMLGEHHDELKEAQRGRVPGLPRDLPELNSCK